MQGVCPSCGSNDLDYGIHPIFDDNYMGFEWECGECGTAGIEWYVTEFVEHDIVEDE